MDPYEGLKREKRRAYGMAIVFAVLVSMVAAPAYSAAIQSVKARLYNAQGNAIKTTSGAVNTKQQGDVGAKVKDTGGGAVESSPVTFDNAPFPPAGAESTGAIDVKTYAGGGSFLGAGDCTAATGAGDIGAGGQGLPQTVDVPAGTIITALLINGTDGQVKVRSDLPALASLPAIQRYRVTNAQPNLAVAFGTGLAITDDLHFKGINSADTGITETAGDCNFVVIGQDL